MLTEDQVRDLVKAEINRCCQGIDAKVLRITMEAGRSVGLQLTATNAAWTDFVPRVVAAGLEINHGKRRGVWSENQPREYVFELTVIAPEAWQTAEEDKQE